MVEETDAFFITPGETGQALSSVSSRKRRGRRVLGHALIWKYATRSPLPLSTGRQPVDGIVSLAEMRSAENGGNDASEHSIAVQTLALLRLRQKHDASTKPAKPAIARGCVRAPRPGASPPTSPSCRTSPSSDNLGALAQEYAPGREGSDLARFSRREPMHTV